jgi:hypothetical protein
MNILSPFKSITRWCHWNETRSSNGLLEEIIGRVELADTPEERSSAKEELILLLGRDEKAREDYQMYRFMELQLRELGAVKRLERSGAGAVGGTALSPE